MFNFPYPENFDALSSFDGNWSNWNDWSDCSVTCDRGVQNRSRTSTSPPPAFGGRSCPGESDETRPCNERPSPGKEKTFASYTLHFYSRQKKGSKTVHGWA